MKITEIETIRLCSHIRTPLKMAYGTVSEIEPVFVCIHTDTGLFGWGEANTIPFVTGETPETILAVLDMLRPMLLGEDPLCIPRIHSIMDNVIDGNPSVKCSIDLALHDLYGQAMGVPLYKLLGGDSDRYWVDVALGIDTPEEMAKSALRYKEEGIRIFKVKAGRDVATDVEAVRCIREACGDDVDIRVDANQGWSESEALEAIDGYRKYHVAGLEQPIPAWDVFGLAAIRAKAGDMTIIADEAVKSPHSAAMLAKIRAADMFSIKLMKAGGLEPAKQIVAIAKANNIQCMLGCMCETGIAISAGAHFVAGEKHITVGDTDGFLLVEEPRVDPGFRFEHGQVILLDRPGLGVKVTL